MELDFKEWLQNEVRFKGLYRMWKDKNPDMPTYAQHDLYTHNLSNSMNKLLKNTKDTGERSPQSPIPSTSPNMILTNRTAKNVSDLTWNKKPEILSVTPSDFCYQTIQVFIMRQFGYKVFQEIPRDGERTQTQQKIAKPNGSNEPIIVIEKSDGSLKLVEGWHRTMSILLTGAPADQIQLIKNGEQHKIDFSNWKPVKIKAFVAFPNNKKITSTEVQTISKY
jgi:hypothetical protein